MIPKKAMAASAGLFLCAFLLQACFHCDESLRITGNYAIQASTDRFQAYEITTVNGPFFLLATYDTENVSYITFPGIMNSAYARDCNNQYDNILITSSVQIYCDKAFTYNGSTIEANTNLLDVDLDGFTFRHVHETRLLFEFGLDFISDVAFAAEEYTFTVEAETDDGLQFANSIQLTMDLLN